jgi:hypothetical protein
LVDVFAQRAGIDPWISSLLRTRHIVVVPMPNLPAYDRHMMYEQDQAGRLIKAGRLIDPGTDFPFARNEYDGARTICLLSACARHVHLLFHKYLFVIALSLHDERHGLESISLGI